MKHRFSDSSTCIKVSSTTQEISIRATMSSQLSAQSPSCPIQATTCACSKETSECRIWLGRRETKTQQSWPSWRRVAQKQKVSWTAAKPALSTRGTAQMRSIPCQVVVVKPQRRQPTTGTVVVEVPMQWQSLTTMTSGMVRGMEGSQVRGP